MTRSKVDSENARLHFRPRILGLYHSGRILNSLSTWPGPPAVCSEDLYNVIQDDDRCYLPNIPVFYGLADAAFLSGRVADRGPIASKVRTRGSVVPKDHRDGQRFARSPASHNRRRPAYSCRYQPHRGVKVVINQAPLSQRCGSPNCFFDLRVLTLGWSVIISVWRTIFCLVKVLGFPCPFFTS